MEKTRKTRFDPRRRGLSPTRSLSLAMRRTNAGKTVKNRAVSCRQIVQAIPL